MTDRLTALLCDVQTRAAARVSLEDDRGDVPGWVLVTVMTAGLVAALWAVAGDTLTNVFEAAIAGTVGGP